MGKEYFKKLFLSFAAAWNGFWFAEISTMPISIFRILLGSLLIQYAFFLFPDMFIWLGKNGILSSRIVNAWQLHVRLNILNLFPNSDLWLTIVFVVFVLSAILLTIGLKTRLSASIAFVCLTSLHARNYLILNSGDVFMRLLCFWLIFSAAGKNLSIDCWLKNKSQWFNKNLAAPWAQRLMQINLSLLYAQAFFEKILGADWRNGTAVYFSYRMAEMHKFSVCYLFDHLWICRIIDWLVLAIELALCTAVWFKPLRYYVLLLALIMHLFIDWTMNIPQFEWLMIFSYVLFIEPDDIDRLLNWFRAFLNTLRQKLHFGQTLI